MAIAQAVASRISLNSAPTNPVNQSEQPPDATAPTSRNDPSTARIELPSPPIRTEPVDAARGAEDTDASDVHEHFQRGLG
eukprot:6013006-Pleurochrysis_carterae.AAC.1